MKAKTATQKPLRPRWRGRNPLIPWFADVDVDAGMDGEVGTDGEKALYQDIAEQDDGIAGRVAKSCKGAVSAAWRAI